MLGACLLDPLGIEALQQRSRRSRRRHAAVTAGGYGSLAPSRGEGMPTPNRLPRALVLAALTVTLALLAPQAAQARAHEKLIADLQLTSHTPGTPTGLTLHLVWPDNGPDGRPKPEAKGVFTLPDGAQIDESAVPTCTASDTELELEGGAACPAGS